MFEDLHLDLWHISKDTFLSGVHSRKHCNLFGLMLGFSRRLIPSKALRMLLSPELHNHKGSQFYSGLCPSRYFEMNKKKKNMFFLFPSLHNTSYFHSYPYAPLPKPGAMSARGHHVVFFCRMWKGWVLISVKKGQRLGIQDPPLLQEKLRRSSEKAQRLSIPGHLHCAAGSPRSPPESIYLSVSRHQGLIFADHRCLV